MKRQPAEGLIPRVAHINALTDATLPPQNSISLVSMDIPTTLTKSTPETAESLASTPTKSCKELNPSLRMPVAQLLPHWPLAIEPVLFRT